MDHHLHLRKLYFIKPRQGAFAHRITERRIALGYTQSDVATLVGVSNQAIAFWETSRHQPLAKYIPALADALDIPRDELMRLRFPETPETYDTIAPEPQALPLTPDTTATPDPRIAIAGRIVRHLTHLNIALPDHRQVSLAEGHYSPNSYYRHLAGLMDAIDEWDDHPDNRTPEEEDGVPF
jgi:transcriptional regulator with XRE-family HTH domain